MLQGIIAAPSVSSVSPGFDQSNLQVIQLLADWLPGLGFEVEVIPLESQPNKANLIATLGKGPGGLVLSGHTDTVPFDAGRWNSDPFKLTDSDHRFYGLGTADMKSFLALAIEAAKDFRAQDLKQPLIILATADEESSMNGAEELVLLGRPKARYAIIGEPTGMRPIRAHKGMMMESIHLQGQAGHSSNPSLGNSALEGMQAVMAEIIQWRRELQHQYQHQAFTIPHPTLNLGHIHGGDNPNRICGECELHIDLRPLPGMPLQELRRQLQQRVNRVAEQLELTASISPLFKGTEAMETPADAELIRYTEQMTGYGAETVAFCTEGPYLQQLGMQTVILGPGNIDQAHQPNEYISQDSLKPTVEFLKNAIRHYCVSPQA
jgi:acetylornithine deacetylase